MLVYTCAARSIGLFQQNKRIFAPPAQLLSA
jgi:hypothetical protein